MTDPTHQNDAANDPASRSQPSIFSLCEADGEALDAIMDARATGADVGPVPANCAQRAECLRGMLGLLELDQAPAPPDDLAVNTLERIRAQQQRQRFASQVQMLSEPRRTLGVAWHQVAAAAAVFIIGASLLMPVMERQRADSRRVAGAANLAMAGQAFNSYAADNLGKMPRGEVQPGSVWWDVGQTQAAGQGLRSNSAHLFLLIRQGYAKPKDLACPENPFAYDPHLTIEHHDWRSPQAVSFSYQNQYTAKALRLDDRPGMALLADRNPLFISRAQGISFDPNTPQNAPSRAHRRPGQNILTADNNVTWHLRPMLEANSFGQEDNIWTIVGVDFYTGTETPTDPADSFLVP